MKIGYFTDHGIGVSETFINDLIKGFEGKVGADKFIHVVGRKEGPTVVENTYFSNFVINSWYLKLINKIEKKFNLRFNFSLKYKLSFANNRLIALKKDPPDVAYVDFGQPAVLLSKYFRIHKIPYVVHFHGMDASSAFNSYDYSEGIKDVFSNAYSIITASHHIKRLLVLRGCPLEKIQVLPFGIDLQKLVPLSWEEREKTGPSVIYLGRLTEKKNPIALIHAFHLVLKQIPEAKLTIIGEGMLKKVVEKRISKLGIADSITMLGAVSQKEAHELLKKHWIFAQHSVTAMDGDQEGFALSPAEAAAFELPVVSTLHNGIPEHVADGKTGFLVREFDFESMAEKLVTLLQNTELIKTMGKAGRCNIGNVLTEPKIRLESIYEILNKAYVHGRHPHIIKK